VAMEQEELTYKINEEFVKKLSLSWGRCLAKESNNWTVLVKNMWDNHLDSSRHKQSDESWIS
jgi:hypothetical protein